LYAKTDRQGKAKELTKVATTIDRWQRPFPSPHDDNSGSPSIYFLGKRYIRLIVDAFTRVGFVDFLVRMSEMPDATCQSFQVKTLGKQLKLAVWKHMLTIQYTARAHAEAKQPGQDCLSCEHKAMAAKFSKHCIDCLVG
jgi:hypothetical protein